jgi:hypothetical protein
MTPEQGGSKHGHHALKLEPSSVQTETKFVSSYQPHFFEEIPQQPIPLDGRSIMGIARDFCDTFNPKARKGFYSLRVRAEDPKTGNPITITYFPEGEILTAGKIKELMDPAGETNWRAQRGIIVKLGQMGIRVGVKGVDIELDSIDSDKNLLIRDRLGHYQSFGENCRIL